MTYEPASSADRDWKLDQKRARVIRAAVAWVHDQASATSIKELENAVVDLNGIAIGTKVPRQDR
jgi:hypothetical protein